MLAGAYAHFTGITGDALYTTTRARPWSEIKLSVSATRGI